MGGPSEELTPSATRRTLYGKVSRYRLDQFLQLFDFPAPTISAEQRFSTNVPLQRLFLMNSDFMQQQAERLARKLAGRSRQRARGSRRRTALLFGREPKADGADRRPRVPRRRAAARLRRAQGGRERRRPKTEKAKEAKKPRRPADGRSPTDGRGHDGRRDVPGGADARRRRRCCR